MIEQLITIAAAQAIAKIALDKFMEGGALWEQDKTLLRSLSIFEKVLPPNHPSLAIVRRNLVELRSKLEDER